LLEIANTLEAAIAAFATLLGAAETNRKPLLSGTSVNSFLSKSVFWSTEDPTAEHVVLFPSLSLEHHVTQPIDINLKDLAALNLAIPICASPENSNFIPLKVLHNVQRSFQILVDARIRSTIAALISQHQGPQSADPRLLEILSTPLHPSATVTTFRVRRDLVKPGLKFNSLIVPFIFEAVIDVPVLDKIMTATIETQGTIEGTLNAMDQLLCWVDIRFDTSELLRVMMEQARLMVKKILVHGTERIAKQYKTSMHHHHHHTFNNTSTPSSPVNGQHQLTKNESSSRMA